MSDKGNATITAKTADADGNLVIPNTLKINGDKHPVTGVAANAFANNTDITSAVIGANVTKIGDGAFAGAINLEKITFKGKKVDIGEGAFKGVINLTVDVQLKNKKELEEVKKKYIEYIEAMGR